MTQGAVGFAENNRRVKCGGFISAVERDGKCYCWRRPLMNPLDWWCSFVFGVSSELGDVLFNYRDDLAPFSAATQWHLRWPTKIDPSVNLRPALLVYNPLRVVAIFPILEKYPTRQIRSLAALPVVLDTPQPHLGLSFCTSPGRAALLTIRLHGDGAPDPFAAQLVNRAMLVIALDIKQG